MRVVSSRVIESIMNVEKLKLIVLVIQMRSANSRCKKNRPKLLGRF